MKVHMAHKIGSKLMIHFNEGHSSIEEARFDKDHNSVVELGPQYQYEMMKEKYPNMNGMGLWTIWDTPSGELEPGCLYWVDHLPENMYWDNHKGPMLHVVCPNNHHWNIDSRASNCGSKNDRMHRCWVRHGDPETGNVHVDKAGHTCSAGGGSIIAGDYHGFLHNGSFKPC